jgi:hypothetical protein
MQRVQNVVCGGLCIGLGTALHKSTLLHLRHYLGVKAILAHLGKQVLDVRLIIQ